MSVEGGKLVGPIISDTRMAHAMVRAVTKDNGREPLVQDRGAYLRIQLPGTCRITRSSLEDELGEEMPLAELERVMPSFAGRIRMNDEEIVWYLEDES